MTEVKTTAPSVEEAIASGLAKLKLPRDQVEIEIIDEGRKGLLGIGGRDAVVRLVAIPVPEKVEAAEKAPAPAAPAPFSPPIAKPAKPPAKPAQPAVPAEPAKPAVKAVSPQDDQAPAATGEVAVEMMQELLGLMEINAQVGYHLTDPDDLTGKQMTVIDITGDDLGLLIGPRGETMNALQYISRLMVGHKTHKRAHFVIDVEGYRERREQALTRMAERMAGKAVKRGTPVTLEAMPAYERRIIHMTLRDSADVRTESIGEGSRRRVRIYPKDN